METKNLIIRETVFEDCEFFIKWETDPDIIEHLSLDGDRSYKDVVEEWFFDRQDKTKLQFTIVKKRSNRPVGRVYITRLDRKFDSLDITRIYISGKENQGQGLGQEVMEELLKFCFLSLHMERVTLDYYTKNTRAAALYTRLGFEREGIARNGCKKNGKYYDLNLMSMLRSEFFEKNHDK